MNRYEFSAVGLMLYGANWKTELAKTLGFSPQSNSVAKIAKGERLLMQGVADDLIVSLEQKSQQLKEVVEFLKQPKKIIINQSSHYLLTFDEHGVRQWDNFQEFPISSIGVIVYNAELPLPENAYEFQSLIIASAGAEAIRTGVNSNLLEIIKKYFDISELTKFNIEEFRLGEKNED